MDNLHISYFDSNIIKFKKLSPLKADKIKKNEQHITIVYVRVISLGIIYPSLEFKIRGSVVSAGFTIVLRCA